MCIQKHLQIVILAYTRFQTPCITVTYLLVTSTVVRTRERCTERIFTCAADTRELNYATPKHFQMPRVITVETYTSTIEPVTKMAQNYILFPKYNYDNLRDSDCEEIPFFVRYQSVYLKITDCLIQHQAQTVFNFALLIIIL